MLQGCKSKASTSNSRCVPTSRPISTSTSPGTISASITKFNNSSFNQARINNRIRIKERRNSSLGPLTSSNRSRCTRSSAGARAPDRPRIRRTRLDKCSGRRCPSMISRMLALQPWRVRKRRARRTSTPSISKISPTCVIKATMSWPFLRRISTVVGSWTFPPAFMQALARP